MSFLIRCIFWLGLVFTALPWNGDELRSDLSAQADQATRALADQAQSLCLKDPLACAEHASTLARAFGAAPSQNTLQPTDLAPAWRGEGKGEGKPQFRRAPG